MKNLIAICALVFASGLMVACNSQKVTPAVQTKVEKTVEKTAGAPKNIYRDVSEVRDPVIETSATLKDDTGIGFNYEGKNLIDNDFSTSWCGTKAGIGDWVSYTFKDPVQAKKMGVLPGFGRDEKIYFQNNRVKELKAVFTDVDGKNSEKTFNFPDKYAMNFVDLTGFKFKSVKFVVSDIYKVNSKPDTCIAELDFWSDYVKNEDASAAMNYYNKYKADKALRPNDFIGKIVFSDQEPDKCNKPRSFKGEPDGYGRLEEDGTFIFFGIPIYVSAYVNEYGKEGDLVDLKTYHENWKFGEGGPILEGWNPRFSRNNIPVVKACDGKLYVNFENGMMSYTPNLGKNRLELYSNGKLVGMEYFYILQ